MTNFTLRLQRLLPARAVLVAALLVGFALPVTPVQAVDGEDEVRNSQMRRRPRRRRRRPRRPPPEAAETEAANEAGDGEGNAAAEGDSSPASETNAESASEELASAAEGDNSGGDDGGATTTGNLRRSNRMEFDARLVRGETAGAGAVVLFNRGNRPLPPLTRERRGFSRQTVRDVLGEVEGPADDDAPSRRSRRRRGGRD